MGTHNITLLATKGLFSGLAKQNLLFHQCVAELIDNSIAAQGISQDPFEVNVMLTPIGGKQADEYLLRIIDNGPGMSLETLKKALQLGESATDTHRLNEHGFGLKNALATLSCSTYYWKLYTKHPNNSTIYSVSGPFDTEMTIEDGASFPSIPSLNTISTLIEVKVKTSFIQTVQGRGRTAVNINKLANWLIEHLGVLYRGYLAINPSTNNPSGFINVWIEDTKHFVPALMIPYASYHIKDIPITLGETECKLRYEHGSLDENSRNASLNGKGMKYYYQNNMESQGIDIRLGNRVIATRQFENIWPDVKRHNSYNDFVGELLIPEMPRGILTTVNNKTDFNLNDETWQDIFAAVKQWPPVPGINKQDEDNIRDLWKQRILAVDSTDKVSTEESVWPPGVKIDVYRESTDGKIRIYEVKVGTGKPIDLYQLKMYWDGLVHGNRHPYEAMLICKGYNDALQSMANKMNEMTPLQSSNKYNFVIKTLDELQLHVQ